LSSSEFSVFSLQGTHDPNPQTGIKTKDHEAVLEVPTTSSRHSLRGEPLAILSSNGSLLAERYLISAEERGRTDSGCMPNTFATRSSLSLGQCHMVPDTWHRTGHAWYLVP